jgi:hypothetical protein
MLENTCFKRSQISSWLLVYTGFPQIPRASKAVLTHSPIGFVAALSLLGSILDNEAPGL